MTTRSKASGGEPDSAALRPVVPICVRPENMPPMLAHVFPRFSCLHIRTFPEVCLFANAIVIAPFRKGLKIAS
ncbi:hypothetical protein AGR4B_Cc60914 [Agrobacterium tumefaciens str. CFBP 5621]|nr:hypothetical protein AGR4B_Cc60914 [Agrobacterium tumefaciens str. CFBP 5621]